jgi:hypothetical protein
MKPTSAHRRGDPQIFPSGARRGKYPLGSWQLESPLAATAGVVRHVEWLLRPLKKNPLATEELRRMKCHISVSVVIFLFSDAGLGERISARLSRRLADSHVDLDLTAYAWPVSQ